MNVEFNENIVKLKEGKIVSSVLLREGRDTPILSMLVWGVSEHNRIELEEKVFDCFERPLNKVMSNSDLYVKWIENEEYSTLFIAIETHKDIKAGSLIKVDNIVFL